MKTIKSYSISSLFTLIFLTVLCLTSIYFIENHFLSQTLSSEPQHTSSVNWLVNIIISESTIITIIVIMIASLFSLLINILIVSPERISEQRLSLRNFIAEIFIFEVAILVRIILAYIILIQRSIILSLIFLVGYLILSFVISIAKWTNHHTYMKSFQVRYLILVPTISLILTILIEIREVHLFFYTFIALTIIIDLFAISITTSFKMLKQDLSNAKKGKNIIISNSSKSDESIKKSLLSDYIQSRNNNNFMVSIGLLFILIGIILIFILIVMQQHSNSEAMTTLFGKVMWGLMFLAFFRLFTRSYEIIVAFINDIISKEPKNSNLDGVDRMKLAIKSLLEVMIIVVVIRTCLEISAELLSSCNFTSDDILSIFETLYNNFLISIATMAFNISFDVSANHIVKTTHVVQVIVSLALISLSIATYISMNKK